MTNDHWQSYLGILIACSILAVAQTAHFYIYFEQTFWLSVKWSIKGSAIWVVILIVVTHLMSKPQMRSNKSVIDIATWIGLALFCGALQVFIAIAIDAIAGTASRPLVEDFLHLYNKRWLQNTLFFGLFVMSWKLIQKNQQGQPKSHNDTKRLKVSDGTRTHWLELNNVSHLESLGNYVCVYTAETKHVVRNTLKNIYKELQEHGFLQVSRSAIVNRRFVSSYKKPSANKVELRIGDHHTVAVGRTYWKSIKAELEL